MEERREVYLDSNLLQKDMRIRIPKQVLKNLNVIAGESVFDIYIDPDDELIILKKVKREKK